MQEEMIMPSSLKKAPVSKRNPAKVPSSKRTARYQTPKKKPFPLIPALVGAVVLAVLLTAGGFGFAASQESHDAFCSSCHSNPESTFYQRSIGTAAVDLASAHTIQKVGCIDCHSGVGVTGRISAELLGARNAAKWYTKTAIQPAPLTVPIDDANCLKCHDSVTVSTDFNNHFHAFLARWQAADPNAGHCVGCHPGHNTDIDPNNHFTSDAITQPVCAACHTILREGGGG
jgi:hypothetical protein